MAAWPRVLDERQLTQTIVTLFCAHPTGQQWQILWRHRAGQPVLQAASANSAGKEHGLQSPAFDWCDVQLEKHLHLTGAESGLQSGINGKSSTT